MREHVRIMVALGLMIGFALILALTRGLELDALIRRLLIDIPIVVGIAVCMVYLLVKASKAVRKAGQG